mmetsp:Transcript_17562/g.47717  ORF Transcript_17562/g.47717 Transcript_17562/m.47717 type:complete len:372 (+) Transcript_17562:281-1396(+)
MKPKPRERRTPPVSRRSGLRTRLALEINFCTIFCRSFFFSTSLISSMPSLHRCLTTSSRNLGTSKPVGKFLMLNRIGWMTKFALLIRHLRSFFEALRWSCSDLDRRSHFSEFSLMSPMVRRYFHLAFSSIATPFFGFFSAESSVASVGVTADLSTNLRPFKLMPKPSTAGNSRRSLLRTTAESSLSFLSAWASSCRAASAPSTSANFTKAEPLWPFSPFGSGTNFTLATFPNLRRTSLKSSPVASKGTLRTKTVRFSSTSKPGFLMSFLSLAFAFFFFSSSPSAFATTSSSPRRPFMRLTSSLVPPLAPTLPLGASSSSSSSSSLPSSFSSSSASSSFSSPGSSAFALEEDAAAALGFLGGSCLSSRCRFE